MVTKRELHRCMALAIMLAQVPWLFGASVIPNINSFSNQSHWIHQIALTYDSDGAPLNTNQPTGEWYFPNMTLGVKNIVILDPDTGDWPEPIDGTISTTRMHFYRGLSGTERDNFLGEAPNGGRYRLAENSPVAFVQTFAGIEYPEYILDATDVVYPSQHVAMSIDAEEWFLANSQP